MSSNQDIIDTFSRIFAGYCGFLIVCTFIFNPMVLFICVRSRKLSGASTFKLLAFSAVNDILSCLIWNQESFKTTLFNAPPGWLNINYCRWLSVFLQFTTLEFAAWMLVSISLDRILSMMIKKWSKYYFGGVRPYLYGAFLAFVIIALNFNEVFTGGYTYDDNGTQVVVCFNNPDGQIPWYSLMSKIFVNFGLIVPYCLLILLNAMIILKATHFSRKQKAAAAANSSVLATSGSDRRKAQMTRTILFITFLYILLSFPGYVVNGYTYQDIIQSNASQMILNLINAIQFSYPALNFFILFFSNKIFASEVKSMIFRIHSTNRVSHATDALKSTP